jgi:hypothetical protein
MERFLNLLFIFFPEEENEPKEVARVPLILRVTATTGARGNSPAYGKPSADSDRTARFFPAAASMLSAGQRDLSPKFPKSSCLKECHPCFWLTGLLFREETDPC